MADDVAPPRHLRGERPWSAWKIAFAVILGLILAAVVGYFAGDLR